MKKFTMILVATALVIGCGIGLAGCPSTRPTSPPQLPTATDFLRVGIESPIPNISGSIHSSYFTNKEISNIAVGASEHICRVIWVNATYANFMALVIWLDSAGYQGYLHGEEFNPDNFDATVRPYAHFFAYKMVGLHEIGVLLTYNENDTIGTSLGLAFVRPWSSE